MQFRLLKMIATSGFLVHSFRVHQIHFRPGPLAGFWVRGR